MKSRSNAPARKAQTSWRMPNSKISLCRSAKSIPNVSKNSIPYSHERRKTTMADREIMENLLLNLKGECDLLMHGAIESATPNVHSAFTSAFNETLSLQNQVYNKMAQMGWYPSTAAEQKQINSVKQKFSSGC